MTCYQCEKEALELSHRSRCVRCEAARADFNADETENLRRAFEALRRPFDRLLRDHQAAIDCADEGCAEEIEESQHINDVARRALGA